MIRSGRDVPLAWPRARPSRVRRGGVLVLLCGQGMVPPVTRDGIFAGAEQKEFRVRLEIGLGTNSPMSPPP